MMQKTVFCGRQPLKNLLSRLLNTLPYLLTLSNIDDAEDSLSWKTAFKEFTYSALEYFVSFIDPVKHR